MEMDKLIPTRRTLLSRLKDWEDQKSWQDFYDIYAGLIYGAAIQAGLTDTEAEDVVQETVVAVAKALPKFEYEPEKCSFKSWLHAITKRKVADQFRRRMGKGRVLESLPEVGNEDAPANAIPDPASQTLDEMWEREWENNLVVAALGRVRARVSPAQFHIFEYHVLQCHSVRETSRALGVSSAKVYLAKHRIASQQRDELAKLRREYA